MGSSDEEQVSRGFKVQDRRRFSAEGELKPEFSGEQEPPPTTPLGTEAEGLRPSRDASVNQETDAKPPAAEPSDEGGAHAAGIAAGAEAREAAPTEINFSAFLMSLSTEALVHLGEMADPANGEQRRDLPMAQQLIDILGMLRDKTRGNLDNDERALLDAILFDLRMKYVEIARRSG